MPQQQSKQSGSNKEALFGLGKPKDQPKQPKGLNINESTQQDKSQKDLKGKLTPDLSNVKNWVLDPNSFKRFVDRLNIEPIDKVKQRVERVKSVDDLTKYIRSGQKQKDVARIQFELKDSDKPSSLVSNIEPTRVRQIFGPDKVYNFYLKDLYKSGTPDKKLEQLEAKLACNKILVEASYKLKGFIDYTNIFSSLGTNSKIAGSKMTSLVEKLYNISSKLPYKYAERVIKVAESIQDPGRVTTKNDKKLSLLFVPGANPTSSFEEVEMMSKDDPKDTYKDKRIKDLYKGFLSILKNESTSPLGEGEEVDKVVNEITRTTKTTESLMAKIDKYKRRFEPY